MACLLSTIQPFSTAHQKPGVYLALRATPWLLVGDTRVSPDDDVYHVYEVLCMQGTLPLDLPVLACTDRATCISSFSHTACGLLIE